MRSNLKKHEFIGLVMIFISGTLIGIGLFSTFWLANRPLLSGTNTLISAKEMLVFPIFFGLGFILWALGQIELKEALPGKRM
ncbi:hypothetical protein JXC34_03495 [Candidatus Woesearchaeota archaeon]|nr:hypothetical protein [Candidatus Woesearchaeota archaeon]